MVYGTCSCTSSELGVCLMVLRLAAELAVDELTGEITESVIQMLADR